MPELWDSSDPKYVFTGKRTEQFGYGKAWVPAWKRAGFPTEGYNKGVEDLRETFAHRLRQAKVTKEDRELLLGVSEALEAHAKHAPDYARLLESVERIIEPQEIPIVNT